MTDKRNIPSKKVRKLVTAATEPVMAVVESLSGLPLVAPLKAIYEKVLLSKFKAFSSAVCDHSNIDEAELEKKWKKLLAMPGVEQKLVDFIENLRRSRSVWASYLQGYLLSEWIIDPSKSPSSKIYDLVIALSELRDDELEILVKYTHSNTVTWKSPIHADRASLKRLQNKLLGLGLVSQSIDGSDLDVDEDNSVSGDLEPYLSLNGVGKELIIILHKVKRPS